MGGGGRCRNGFVISFFLNGTAHGAGAAATDFCRLLGSVNVKDDFLSHELPVESPGGDQLMFLLALETDGHDWDYSVEYRRYKNDSESFGKFWRARRGEKAQNPCQRP